MHCPRPRPAAGCSTSTSATHIHLKRHPTRGTASPSSATMLLARSAPPPILFLEPSTRPRVVSSLTSTPVSPTPEPAQLRLTWLARKFAEAVGRTIVARTSPVTAQRPRPRRAITRQDHQPRVLA